MLKMSHEVLGKMCRSRAQLHRARLSLFSELMATKVALLSLCSSIGIPRNAVFTPVLSFHYCRQQKRTKNNHFYSTASSHPSRPKLFALLGPHVPRRSWGSQLFLGALCLAGPPAEAAPTTSGPPRSPHHLPPPVLAKVPRAAQL